MRLPTLAPVLVLCAALLLMISAGVGAQEMGNLPEVGQQGAQSLRPYWHVFIAYALAIVLIGGWAVSIARRLRQVESRLVDQGE